RPSAASLYAGAAVGSAGARSHGRGAAPVPYHQGRGAEPDPSALGLRLPSTLPDGGRRLQAVAPATARAAAGPLGGVHRGQLNTRTARRVRGDVSQSGEMKRRNSMRARLILAAAALSLGVAGATTGGSALAQTPKRGGILTYMIPADSPPSFDGHRETTFATVHAAAPFYSVLIRVPPDNP